MKKNEKKTILEVSLNDCIAVQDSIFDAIFGLCANNDDDDLTGQNAFDESTIDGLRINLNFYTKLFKEIAANTQTINGLPITSLSKNGFSLIELFTSKNAIILLLISQIDANLGCFNIEKPILEGTYFSGILMNYDNLKGVCDLIIESNFIAEKKSIGLASTIIQKD